MGRPRAALRWYLSFLNSGTRRAKRRRHSAGGRTLLLPERRPFGHVPRRRCRFQANCARSDYWTRSPSPMSTRAWRPRDSRRRRRTPDRSALAGTPPMKCRWLARLRTRRRRLRSRSGPSQSPRGFSCQAADTEILAYCAPRKLAARRPPVADVAVSNPPRSSGQAPQQDKSRWHIWTPGRAAARCYSEGERRPASVHGRDADASHFARASTDCLDDPTFLLGGRRAGRQCGRSERADQGAAGNQRQRRSQRSRSPHRKCSTMSWRRCRAFFGIGAAHTRQRSLLRGEGQATRCTATSFTPRAKRSASSSTPQTTRCCCLIRSSISRARHDTWTTRSATSAATAARSAMSTSRGSPRCSTSTS